jgi:hypothetical protein
MASAGGESYYAEYRLRMEISATFDQGCETSVMLSIMLLEIACVPPSHDYS